MAVDYYYSYNKKEHKVEEEDEDEDEEEYIDMEVSSFAHFFSLSRNSPVSSPQHNREFEFQMSSSMNVEKQSTTSPADELFYMGKLLPLQLPPRLQMVEKLLQDSTPKMFNHANNDEFYSTPLDTNAATTPTTGLTPFESCNVSPAESCQVSRELNPEEYFGVYASNEVDDQKGFQFDDNSNNVTARKSWTRKLKTKIKSLFGKSGEVASSASFSSLCAKTKEGGDLEKPNKESMGNTPCINQSQRVVSRERFDREDVVKEVKIRHRRSFSGAFKRRSSTTTKLSSSSSSSCSSSSSSSSSGAASNPNGLKELLKRSSSANSEIETSLIQGAIAHCKQSSEQAKIRSRKALSEAGCHSFPSSRFAALDHKTSLCRG